VTHKFCVHVVRVYEIRPSNKASCNLEVNRNVVEIHPWLYMRVDTKSSAAERKDDGLGKSQSDAVNSTNEKNRINVSVS